MPEDLSKLTDVQRRFVQALGEVQPPSGAQDYSQAGAPGSPAIQGVSGPGYAAAYQPAQSFNDPAYQQKLYEWEQDVRRTAEATRAEQAIQAGIRFIYQRRYDEDLKRGVPEQQAFSKMMLGIAMHGPKTDPIKAFEAFRPRPAPTAQMMKFGTNEVPGVVNVDRTGAQRWTPIPASVLPQAASEIITKYDPGTKRHYQLRNNQWYPVTAAEAARLTPLEKTVESIERDAMKDASETLRGQSKRATPNTNVVAQATKDFQSASNALQKLDKQNPVSEERPSPSTKKLYFNPETGQLQDTPYASKR